jgi:PEP-CTERM motif
MASLPRVGVTFLTFAILGAAAAAEADPIPVRGQLEGDRSFVTVELRSSQRGFSLNARGAADDGLWAPGFCDGTCLPGQELSLDARFSGSDFGGTASVDGHRYNVGLNTINQAAVDVDFAGAWTAPRFTGATHATVVSPFTFEGRFDFPSTVDQPPSLDLFGNGNARLRLAWSTQNSGWALESARYQFTGPPNPVPEPGTVVLLASGLAALAYRRRLVPRATVPPDHQNGV